MVQGEYFSACMYLAEEHCGARNRPVGTAIIPGVLLMLTGIFISIPSQQKHSGSHSSAVTELELFRPKKHPPLNKLKENIGRIK